MVERAVHAFRRDGVEATALKQIMEELGLTVGGFYRHFPSKSALVEEAVTAGLRQSLAHIRQLPDDDGLESLRRFASVYLSQPHRRGLAEGCVLAALGSEVARADDQVKSACEAGLDQVHAELERRIPADTPDLAEAVWGLIALQVGGLLLSRIVASDAKASEILASCRTALDQLLAEASDAEE
jgi:TetR/AcrR family transcriptional repressor of nem operon